VNAPTEPDRPRSSEAADDRDDFVAAVEAELASGRLWIERMQVRAATAADMDRAKAEGMIRSLRTRYTTLALRVAELRAAAPGTWPRHVGPLLRARREFERAIDEAVAAFA
jgi:hypothetical protein